MQTVTDYRAALISAIDTRIAHEQSKNANNTSIVKTLTDIRKSVDHDKIAEVMLASNVSADFINRAERSNARYNVYAAEKVANIARALAKVATLNHYTRAIVATADALEKNEKTLSHKDATCACSKDVKHTDSKREALIKTTRYQKVVASNTATTQSSSSLNALATFNAISEARDTANAVVYSLNRESAVLSLIAAEAND